MEPTKRAFIREGKVWGGGGGRREGQVCTTSGERGQEQCGGRVYFSAFVGHFSQCIYGLTQLRNA